MDYQCFNHSSSYTLHSFKCDIYISNDLTVDHCNLNHAQLKRLSMLFSIINGCFYICMLQVRTGIFL
jgi:hypothetical protein